MKSLKLPFEGSDLLNGYYSSEGQDLFAISCLNGKKNGTFLDIGANYAKVNNNTYLLEKGFGWTGVCVDILDGIQVSYKEEKRTAKLIMQDATVLDYDDIIRLLDTNKVDFLSLDLEPAAITYKCLESIPFNKIEFSVVTFEHDSYRHGVQWKIDSRNLLKSVGYELLCADVGTNGSNMSFEDWYVNPKYVDMDKVNTLRSSGVEGRHIVANW